MKHFKVLSLLFAISFSLVIPAHGQEMFKVTCYDDLHNPYALYFEVKSKGSCSLIAPKMYQASAADYSGQITIPGSVEYQAEACEVTDIDGESFTRSSVTSVSVPATVKNIGSGAFSSCSSLMSVTVSDENPYYSSSAGALYNKDETTLKQVAGGMTSYELPASVTEIDGNAFFGVEKLETLTVEEGNENYEIDNGVLFKKDGEGNKSDVVFISVNTENLVIPEGITRLSYNLMASCKNSIKTISIPASVTSIDTDFSDCQELTAFTVNSANPRYKSVNGGLIDMDDNSLSCCPPGKTSYDVPEGVEVISFSAFPVGNKLESLSFPKSVRYLPDYILYKCLALETISVDADNETFMSANGGLIKKSNNLLMCCPPGRTSFDVPEDVAIIGEMAFYNCMKLTELSFPANVESIEADFSLCSSLEAFVVDAGNKKYESANGGLIKKDGQVLLCCPPGKASFVIPDNVLKLDMFAFNNCALLTTIKIPASVESLSDSSFDGCYSLETFEVDAENKYFAVFDDVLFDKELQLVYKCPAKKESFTLTFLPEISGSAFEGFNGQFTINITDTDKPFVKEGVGFSVPQNTEMHYYRKLEAYHLGTTTLFFTPENYEDFIFYQLSDADDDKLNFVKVPKEEFLNAVAYLYKNADDDNIATEMYNLSGGYVDSFTWTPKLGDWKIWPTFTSKELDGAQYFVLKDNAFKSIDATETISPLRGYLEYLGEKSIDEMEIYLDGLPTGIKVSELNTGTARIGKETRYNVLGQKVGRNYKGIVISNGKKYLSK